MQRWTHELHHVIWVLATIGRRQQARGKETTGPLARNSVPIRETSTVIILRKRRNVKERLRLPSVTNSLPVRNIRSCNVVYYML
jgi:hypothetical protein